MVALVLVCHKRLRMPNPRSGRASSAKALACLPLSHTGFTHRKITMHVFLNLESLRTFV
jgi:hypothetical protein